MTIVRSLYAGYRFPTEIISHAVWLYFRFPPGLRMVEEPLAARGSIVSHETIRRWRPKFGQTFANRIRRRLPRAGDKWHLDEVAPRIAGKVHWLWRAVECISVCRTARSSVGANEPRAVILVIILRFNDCNNKYTLSKQSNNNTKIQLWQ